MLISEAMRTDPVKKIPKILSLNRLSFAKKILDLCGIDNEGDVAGKG